MASRHSRQDRETRRTVTIYLTISFAVAFSAIIAAVVVRAADQAPTASTAGHLPAASVPSAELPISQEGRLIAVSPTSVTARGPDGVPRTYQVDGNTNAITPTGSRVGDTASAFGVNDEVAIVGVLRNGTAVATAVAHRELSSLDGPPMDVIVP